MLTVKLLEIKKQFGSEMNVSARIGRSDGCAWRGQFSGHRTHYIKVLVNRCRTVGSVSVGAYA